MNLQELEIERLGGLFVLDSAMADAAMAGASDAYEARDLAYHQGTVWPWLIGAYVEACARSGRSIEGGLAGVLEGLVGHVAEFGLGSISETADGDAPHGATGCPFQAWSVAELIRARQFLSD